MTDTINMDREEGVKKGERFGDMQLATTLCKMLEINRWTKRYSVLQAHVNSGKCDYPKCAEREMRLASWAKYAILTEPVPSYA